MLRIITFLTLCLSLIHAQMGDCLEPIPCLNKEFKIAIHLVQDEEGNIPVTTLEIEDVIDELNTFFSPICVSFSICFYDTIPNTYFYELDANIQEGDQLRTEHWQENMINLHYVQTLDRPAAGYACGGGIANAECNYVIIQYGDNQISTVAHEFGHLFGLLHTFEGSGTELADGSNCTTAGDRICDTPADPYNESHNTSDYVDDNCKFISSRKDANNDFYLPHVGNIMSYYPSKCICEMEFTCGQYRVMAATYLNSDKKAW